MCARTLADQIGTKPITDAVVGRKLDGVLEIPRDNMSVPVPGFCGDLTAAILDDRCRVVSRGPGLPYKIGQALTS